jgi:hypothetical protein
MTAGLLLGLFAVGQPLGSMGLSVLRDQAGQQGFQAIVLAHQQDCLLVPIA